MPDNQDEKKLALYQKKLFRELMPGDIVLHPIYRSDGLLLMAKDKELTDGLIDIIRRHSDISTPFLIISKSQDLEQIKPGLLDDPGYKKDIEEITREYNSRTSTQASTESFLNDEPSKDGGCEYSTNYFTKLLSLSPLWCQLGDMFESEQLRIRTRNVKNAFLDYMMGDNIFYNLFDALKHYSDILLIHSINTACISLMLGLSNELVDEDLIDLAIAALFINTGFLQIPKDDFETFLRDKSGGIEPVKKHLEEFANMTIDSPGLRKKEIIFGILDHHEFMNGQGYPNGKKGNEISLYGRLLHIATSYDELVGGYRHEEAFSPIEALRMIYENKDDEFDWELLHAFIYRTTYFKLGSEIVLPNHETGIIIGFDDFARAPHLPTVRMKNGITLNLYKSRSK